LLSLLIKLIQNKNRTPLLLFWGRLSSRPNGLSNQSCKSFFTNKFNLIKTTILGKYQFNSTNTFMTS